MEDPAVELRPWEQAAIEVDPPFSGEGGSAVIRCQPMLATEKVVETIVIIHIGGNRQREFGFRDPEYELSVRRESVFDPLQQLFSPVVRAVYFDMQRHRS